MVSQDYGFQIKDLSRRIAAVEELIGKLNRESNIYDAEWDTSTLLREWGISKRTAANYRQQGLQCFKRGGRLYYTANSRKEFTNIKPSKNGNTK